MTYGTHESSQCVEVVKGDDTLEIEYQLSLDCSNRGTPAQLYGRPEDCYEAEAPEFELGTVHVLDGGGKLWPLTEYQFYAVVGQEIADKMVEDAITEAIESGEF